LKLKFCKKIHSNYGGGYCCKEKIKFEILAGESNGLAAAAPDRDDIPVCRCGPEGGAELECGRIDIDAPESTRKLKLFLESFKKIRFLVGKVDIQ
jgi:hypothetical protein